MICDVKIDDRLIHGQVCGFWIPHYDLQRIVIVDDEIVADEARKTALKFGCPARCKLSIFSVDSAVDKFSRHIDEGSRVMILCNRPQPLLQMVEKGFPIKEISVGNLSSKPGSVCVQRTMYVTAEERSEFLALAERGVALTLQATPTDAKEDLAAALKKIEF